MLRELKKPKFSKKKQENMKKLPLSSLKQEESLPITLKVPHSSNLEKSEPTLKSLPLEPL